MLHLRGLGLLVRVMDIVAVGLIVGLLLAYIFYGRLENTTPRSFTFPLIIILLGVFLSIFPAQYVHGQPLHITFYQQRHMYALLFYFLLFYLSPRPQWIINVLFYTAMAVGLLYIVQYVLYPFLITDAKIFIQRGTIRMNLPGTYFMYIGFFLSVDRFFTNYEKRFGLGALLLFTVAILSGFRTTVGLYIFITAAFLLFSKKVKNKMLLFLLAAVFATSGFFAFHSIATEMVESALEESTEGTENIRYRAASYLLSLNKEDPSTYVLGNGEPSQRSRYGMKLFIIAITRGFYLSDIGIFGFYFKFGIFAAAAVIFIILRVVLTRLPKETFFIRLFFLYHLLVIANTLIAFDNLPDITAICMLLYLYDTSRNNANAPPEPVELSQKESN